ncbi:flagellar hook-associated protein 3 FlgL [Vibrio xiamenensis]|uniref:Flagellar hook-associated protein 3 FlgL n=1 Tax=Vibrio xiamenensis TaxID=861298 RepID=A0A1G7Y393_9VIBR|nr:flagellar hook-associated protein FlgL [Vibrio xiamenensis]SDG90736.1 flagellar hook-associated protein 3 FlgL [Vibrio xiamenensis]
MRISDTQFSKTMLQSLDHNNAGLGKVMQEMATGDRLTKLSDDPMSTIKLLNLDREGSAISQYKANIANVNTTLSSQEVYLDSVNESLKHMRELVLWGSNGTMDPEARQGIVTELVSLRDAMQAAFNAQDEEGHYLFSGTKSDQPPLVIKNGQYVVEGNGDKRVVTVAKGVTMESNMTAKDILDLDGANDVFNMIDGLVAEFQSPTPNFRPKVEQALHSVDGTMNNVLMAITEMGGRHNNLDLMDSAHGDNKLFVDKLTSDLSALDYAEASVRLNNYMAALKATQASYVKIDDLSLFDRL